MERQPSGRAVELEKEEMKTVLVCFVWIAIIPFLAFVSVVAFTAPIFVMIVFAPFWVLSAVVNILRGRQ